MPRRHRRNQIIEQDQEVEIGEDQIGSSTSSSSSRMSHRGETRFSGKIPAPAKLDTSHHDLATSWKRFERSWENYAKASRLDQEEPSFQTAVLLATAGEDVTDIYDGLQFISEEDKNDPQVVLQKLREYCVGESHEAYESYKFHSRKQQDEESFDAFVAALKKLSKNCNYGSFEQRMLRDQIIFGLRDPILRQKLLENKDITFEKCLIIGRSYETSRQQSKSMTADARSRAKEEDEIQYLTKNQNGYKKNMEKNRSKCKACGKIHSLYNCPAKDAECRRCSKKGHYAHLCFSKLKVRQVSEEETTDSDEEVDIILGIVNEVNEVKEDMWNVELSMNNKPILFRIDTGADVTVISKQQLDDHGLKLLPTTKRLFGAGRVKLDVLGKCQVKLGNKSGDEVTQDVYVLPYLTKPLLGKKAIEALNIIERVNEVQTTSNDTNIKGQYSSLFTGLGKLQKVYKIELHSDHRPFAIVTPRRLPLPMKDKVEKELKRLEEQDIIRPVHTPTDWCAPIVAVPKSNDRVRLCVDLTKLNESVKRENFPLPTTDNLLAEISGAKFFSKLDCNSGFHQIPLAEESQELTTFITPFGRFCYKRMPFGISSGPEIFHREMVHILSGIPGVICDIDDVLISGATQEEHDDRLHSVLHRMQEAGVTLNEKCVFSASKIKFLGHIITPEGIQIDPDKVSAITNFPPPKDVPELRRFMGMVNHVGKFAPNLAENSKPLRDLLKKDNEWVWDTPQQQAFELLKSQLTSAPVLAHYSPSKETKIASDASGYALGCVMKQRQEDGEFKPVFYHSRSMTSTEQRYAQVEKEALAVTWACEKFSDYITGIKDLTLETDHRPLLALLKQKNLDELPPRIQRFRMRLMRFNYKIEYTRGKNLVTADALSRAPYDVPSDHDLMLENEVNDFVRSVMDGFPASEKRLEEIRQTQTEDDICSRVKNYCKTSWPENARTDPDLKPYWTVRNELTIQNDILLFQSRLVIPRRLQEDILSRLHQSHMGIVKCRALARSCVWWPGLSQKIEQVVRECKVCEKERKEHPEPLQPTPTPAYAWQHVGIDLFEWKKHQYVIVVDYYSRWIDFKPLTKSTSKSVIERLKSVFATYGIPELVKTDNGPCFSSRDFADFAESYGFVHLTSSPLYAKSNGEAERAVQTVKNLLSKAEDPYIALLNYRATPLQQGQSPAELLMGRNLRTRVPAYTARYEHQDVDTSSFRERDSCIKLRQKKNYDQRHRVKPLSRFEKGQKVWVKTPKDISAEIIDPVQPSGRSYRLKTDLGEIRRNRLHLRKA